jgi:hypothetical protein
VGEPEPEIYPYTNVTRVEGPEHGIYASSRYLRVPCVIVPKGSPPPLEWMAAHPHHMSFPAVFVPRKPREPDMALEPQPGAAGQAEPPPEKPVFGVRDRPGAQDGADRGRYGPGHETRRYHDG